MRSLYYVSICSIVTLLLIHNSYSSEFPLWFGRLSHSQNEVIGYGMGDSYEQAMTNAKKEIAQTIMTHITSESKFEQKLINNDYKQNINISIQETTDVVLDSIQRIKQENKDGVWYIALKYENLHFEKKFANKLDIHSLHPENQNRYLKHTPLIKSLNEEVGFQLNYKVIRKSGNWYLRYKDKIALLNSSDFEKLFINYPSNYISLSSSKTELIEGDVFSFTINSSIDGYLSLLNVCETGEVYIIENNRRIRAGEKVTIPDQSGDMELFAAVLQNGKPTYDLYLALNSPKKINLGRISHANDTLDQWEKNHKFEEIIDLLDKHEFCSIIIPTKPNQ